MKPSAFVRLLLSYLRPYWVQAGLVLLGLLLEMAFNALVPYSFKYLIDQALIGKNREVLLLVVAGLGAGAIAVALAGLGRDYLYARMGSCMLRDMRHRLFVHLQRLSMDFHARHRAGDLLSRFTGDLSEIEHTLMGFFAQPLKKVYSKDLPPRHVTEVAVHTGF
ncbi:MAG: ABC transporter ATP-binding protein [Candidatus Latescibacteria bacterium]|nr:ABC transporter ATP-binding protein [Candidatus Latescibacterota bacterium]